MVNMVVVLKLVWGILYLSCCDYREYGSGCMLSVEIIVSMENIVGVALVSVEEKILVII